MRKTTVIYYAAAVALLLFFMSLALPFLKNLAPGAKLVYSIFPVLLILLTHFSRPRPRSPTLLPSLSGPFSIRSCSFYFCACRLKARWKSG